MLAYILVDTTWLILFPRCVMLAQAILIHHALLLLTWVIPIYCWSGWEFYMSAALIVELNTFFLIAKRRVGAPSGTGVAFLYEKEGRIPPPTDPTARAVPAPAAPAAAPMLLSHSAALHNMLSYADHITWVSIRCIWLPISAYNAWAVWAHLARQCSSAAAAAATAATAAAATAAAALSHANDSSIGNTPPLRCYANSGLFVLLVGAALLWQNALWTRDKYRGTLRSLWDRWGMAAIQGADGDGTGSGNGGGVASEKAKDKGMGEGKGKNKVEDKVR
jgi:hypothetical protein